MNRSPLVLSLYSLSKSSARRYVLSLASLFLLSAAPAFADTFSYSFIDTGVGSTPLSFTYLSPTLIMTDTSFTPLTCTYAGNPKCTSIDYNPQNATITFTVEFYSNGLPSSSGTTSDLFIGSLTKLGTQANRYGQTLTITQNVISTATPEPSSIALLGTGLLGMAGVARRRSARA